MDAGEDRSVPPLPPRHPVFSDPTSLFVSVLENGFFQGKESDTLTAKSKRYEDHNYRGGNLGTDGHTKTDEFSEKFQTAFDPPSFSENHIAIFSKNG